MPLSEYARSEYEEDSEFVLSEEEDDGGLDPPGLQTNPNSPRAEKARLEILDDVPSDPSLRSSPTGHGPNRSANSSVVSDSNSLSFISHVDQVMDQVKTLEVDTRWSRVLKHRTGVQVFAQKHAKAVGKNKVVPIFKGVGLIRGYSPPSVFAVIGSSKLWDEWYEDGNLVENLSDQISLTYMCMKAGLGSRTRDLSLVEKVEAMTDGSIYFCASSVDTPRVPVIPGRIRAHIDLNAWVLQPVTLPSTTHGTSTTATKVTCYLQVNIKTFIAEAITQRYLARRPLCITKIDAYLQKYGSPSVQLEDGIEAYPHRGGARRSYSRNYMSLKQIEFPKEFPNDQSNASSATNTLMSRKIRSHISSIGSFGQKPRNRLPNSLPSPALSTNDLQNRRLSETIQLEKVPTDGGPSVKYQAPLLIDHLKPNPESFNWISITQNLESLNSYLNNSSSNRKDWQVVEISANSVRMLLNSRITRTSDAKLEEQGLLKLPMVKSEAILNTRESSPIAHPITKEQVLLTILSNVAQQLWDQNLHGYSKLDNQTHQHRLLLSTDNGFDQGTYLGTMRAIYPHIRDDSFFCFDQLVVRQSNSSSSSSSGNEVSADESKIVVVHHSIEDEEGYLNQLEKKFQDSDQPPKVNSILREKIEKKVLSKIDVEGWIIQDSGSRGSSSDQIQIVHLSALHLNLKTQHEQYLQSSAAIGLDSIAPPASLPEFLTRLISSNIASRPYQVVEFIREFGFAPGFVKWMDGQIHYLGDHDHQTDEDNDNYSHSSGGIRSGEVQWRFTRKQDHNAVTGLGELPSIKVSPVSIQTCWFQWSERMYPNGIELALEPSDAADVRLASDTHNTIQFNWKRVDNPPRDQVIKLKAKRNGSAVDGTLDPSAQQAVIFNGNRLIDTVPLQVVQLKKKKRKSNTNQSTSAVANGNLQNDEVQDASNHPLNQSTEKSPSSTSQPLPVNGEKTAITSISDSSQTTNTPDENRQDTKNDEKKSKDKQALLVAPNVAVIINQHLYFTRPQVLFFLVCIGCAYIYGRLG